VGTNINLERCTWYHTTKRERGEFMINFTERGVCLYRISKGGVCSSGRSRKEFVAPNDRDCCM
jgi:hypothetical protein